MKLGNILFVLLILTGTQQATAAALAGHVIIASGQVSATGPEGAGRPLKRRGKIFEGDTLKTGPDSSAQIRFVDKALLSLKENTQLDINAYRFSEDDQSKNQAIMKLVTGGFRTITGAIGKGNKAAYKVETPTASIGIRGTHYEVMQENAKSFVMAVWKGGINVENAFGSMDLGLGAAYNYVRVTEGVAPQGLLEPPQLLLHSGKASGSKKAPKPKVLAQQQPKQPRPLLPVDTCENDLDECLDNIDPDRTQFVPPPGPLESPDSRLTDAEYARFVRNSQRVMAQPVLGQVQGNDLLTGFTFLDDNDQVVMAVRKDPDALLDISDLEADNLLDNFDIIRMKDNLVILDQKVAGRDNINWGLWVADTAAAPNTGTSIDVYSTPDSTVASTVDKHGFFLTAEAASLNDFAGKGQVRFGSLDGSLKATNMGDAIGVTSNQNQITPEHFNAHMDVDFDQLSISGNLNFETGHDAQGLNPSERWDANFSGSLNGAATQMNVNSGTFNSQSGVTGEVNGLFVAPGDAFAGGFSLIHGVNEADGLFMLNEGAPIQREEEVIQPTGDFNDNPM